MGLVIRCVLRAAAIFCGFAITVVGIPFAINRLIRWAFIIPVVMVEGTLRRQLPGPKRRAD